MRVNDSDPTGARIQLELCWERQRHSEDRISRLELELAQAYTNLGRKDKELEQIKEDRRGKLMKQADQWLGISIWQLLGTIAALAAIVFAILYWSVPNYRTLVIPLIIIMAVITLIFGILTVISQIKGIRARKIEKQSPQIKITLQIDEEPITIETSDVGRINEILQIVKDLQTNSSSTIEARTKISQPPGDTSSSA